jgi:hypothetical protein
MRATLFFFILVFVAACGSDPTSDIFAVQGIVRGQVTSPDGTPVSNAWVALDGLYPSDNGHTKPVYDSTQTDVAAVSRDAGSGEHAGYAHNPLDQGVATRGEWSGPGRNP